MHFSKTYTQLLERLPPELRENAIQYRQLKKLINQIVKELCSLGLSPDLLHKLLDEQDSKSLTSLEPPNHATSSPSSPEGGRVPSNATSLNSGHAALKVVYEFSEQSSRIEPRLRISLETLEELSGILHSRLSAHKEAEYRPGGPDQSEVDDSSPDDESENASPTPLDEDTQSNLHEVVIPLVSDSQFFELLYATLEHMSTHLKSVESDFMETLTTLSRTIGDSARPASSSHSLLGGSFRALSPLKDNAGTIQIQRGSLSKSDLYSWREIFQVYVEAEVFESTHEQDRGERSVEESDRRLQLFAKQVTQRGLAAQGKFKLKRSRSALETFFQLNILILNIKKFQLANSEATRKILKKHAKRTALPLPPEASSSQGPPQLAMIPQVRSFSLPRILVQAIGETLLPIIPHIDDYSCLICTSIAFKPIRLDCGHLFCVRCLVKMQKRGKANCPMCRSPSVLVANRSNVDWALMNFMQDWFPIEAKEKLKSSEKEATAEELAELGLDPNATCIIM
ncbi:hypothetical protein AN958_02006 [Leucoagaricus sp. SymC.cos]|nr:hypothetical protein AN958_02006 [Leucoagaricus sp. SymC.cos]